jgi:hypothetical protein
MGTCHTHSISFYTLASPEFASLTAAERARREFVGARRGRVRVVERRLRAEAVNIPLTVSDTDGK